MGWGKFGYGGVNLLDFLENIGIRLRFGFICLGVIERGEVRFGANSMNISIFNGGIVVVAGYYEMAICRDCSTSMVKVKVIDSFNGGCVFATRGVIIGLITVYGEFEGLWYRVIDCFSGSVEKRVP